MKGDRERFLESGMDDFLTKPIKRQALEDAIIASAAKSKRTRSETVDVKGGIIDLNELFQTMNGDRQLVKECFDDFYRNHGPMLHAVRTGIDENDEDKVKHALLNFRDSVKLLSCKIVMDAAFSLERAFIAKNEALVEKQFDNLHNTCVKIKDFVVRYEVKDLFMKFLLVDDEFVSRKKSQKILSQYGECDVAANGLEALNAFLRAHNEHDPYNIVFLDIDMPDIDGNMVLSKIRQWETARDLASDQITRVALISAHDREKALTAELKPGRETFFSKPVNRDKLVSAFKSLHMI
jgi:two-component system chemotaxis response regulator CheY